MNSKSANRTAEIDATKNSKTSTPTLAPTPAPITPANAAAVVQVARLADSHPRACLLTTRAGL